MNTTLQRLLPPQATALERAVLEISPAWDELADVGAGLDHTRPDPFKPWLVAEWELAQFSQYFPDLDALLAAGLPWLLERGSAAAVRRVLGWLGYGAAVIEEDGAYLQIDLGRIASADEITRIAHLVRASIPAHIRFYRVFHDHDLRPLRLDSGRLDGAMLDNDSGVWVDVASGAVRASFGDTRRGAATAPALDPVATGHTTHRASLLSYDDRMLLDAWRLDSEILVDAYGGLAELFAGTCNPPTAPAPAAAMRTEIRAAAVDWLADTPALAGAALRTASTTPVPVHPHRHWPGQRWAGAWRSTFPLTRTEET